MTTSSPDLHRVTELARRVMRIEQDRGRDSSKIDALIRDVRAVEKGQLYLASDTRACLTLTAACARQLGIKEGMVKDLEGSEEDTGVTRSIKVTKRLREIRAEEKRKARPPRTRREWAALAVAAVGALTALSVAAQQIATALGK